MLFFNSQESLDISTIKISIVFMRQPSVRSETTNNAYMKYVLFGTSHVKIAADKIVEIIQPQEILTTLRPWQLKTDLTL